MKTLKSIEEVLGDVVVVCGREITKKFEEIKKEKASVLFEYFSKIKPRGEFVVLLNQAVKHPS